MINILLILNQLYYHINAPTDDKPSFVKDILPILSAGIVVVTFIIDRIIGFKSREKEARRTWYFKAHLELGIQKIDVFFNELTGIVNPAIKKIVLDITNGDDPKSYITDTLKTISDIKRKFSIEVLTPIQFNYPIIFKESEQILNEIEDAASVALANNESEQKRLDTFYLEVYMCKAKFMLTLSQPVLGKFNNGQYVKLIAFFRKNISWKKKKK